MASDSDGELDATFSCMEQPPLIKQLRGILSEYPDNGQIIKELLQNAEDARAREVEIIYDERIINQSEDKKKPFRKFFKGPALCVKNNSMFADRDWKGIKMVASSVKEDDKLKVGRFGLGFKSVFHMTDFPCIISGERVLLIDPTRPSDQVNAEMKLKYLRRIRGMDVDAFLKALGNLGINETIINQGNYPGTVFWFPLRNETSKISSTLYDREKIMDLFSSFECDSSEVLIFLSHLESVSLHIKTTSGVINKVAGAEIIENKLNIRQERMEFVEKIKVSRYPQHSPFVCSYKMNIQSTTRDGSVEDTKWVIVHYFMGNNSSQTLQNLVADPDLGYNPLVGVAMPVKSSSSAKFEGHVFCFLPLPKEGHRLTGLPVHINGFFSLSQNRHHMKWATDDQDESKVKDKHVVWNRTLIEECLPEAYKNLFGMLLEESRINGNTDTSVEVTYKAVPDEAIVLDKWKRIPKKLNSYLHQLPFLYSKSKQRYVVIREALFATFRDLKPDMAPLQGDIAYTISRMSVAYVSTGLETFQKLEFYNGEMMKDLTPTLFADMLRQESRILEQLTRSQRLSVLAYLLSSGNYSCLRGLKLLPVASGAWSPFGTGSPVFLCGSEEEKLFPESAARMITPRPDLDENIRNHFEKMASNDTYQLKSLNQNFLSDLLNESLQLKVGTSYTITHQGQLDWLQKVWCYINRNPASIDKKTHTPIIPEMKKDSNGPMKIQLHRMSSLFLRGDGIPEDLCDCFRKLDVTILPYLPTWTTEVNMSHFTTVHSPQTDSMNNLLEKVWSLPDRETIVDRFNQKVSKPHKDKFVEFMATFSLNTNAVKLLRLLSIFRFGSKPYGADIYDGYTSLDNSPTFFAANDIPVKLPRAFVIGTQDSTCCLLRNLNAVEEGRVSLVKMILTEMKRGRHYNKEEIEQFMLYFIENFGEFATLVEIASEIPFVTTDTRKLRPKDLFNPDDPLVWNLFDGQKDKFPLFLSGMNDRTKYAMKRLGLKEMNMITPNDIADSADLVSSYSHDKSKHTLCVTKSNAILTVLNAYPSMLQQQIRGNTLKSKLSQLKCIPCALERPSHYPPSLPWFPKFYSKFFCTPLEARIKDYKNECLVGSTMPLVESAYENLHADFGWNCIPPLEKVIDQLTYVKQHYKIQEKSSVLPLVNQIYDVLSTNVMKIDLDKLKTNALIWTGDSFEEPGDIVITLKASDLHNLIPYAYSIPPEFSRYETLFKTVGCHLEQSAFVLIHVLDRIQAKHIQEQPSEQYEKDCELVQKVVSKLAEKRAEIMGKDVLLPIRTNSTFNQLQFRRAAECTFDNASRYEHEEGDTSIVFVSEIIAIDVAKALGAKLLNIQILSGTEGMGIEGFGQSEKLTDRIQKLISESYVDGLSVPKELIQNADDAGATIVKFLYDERQHDESGTMLLSKEMAHCQGPSIVVYNDATFTDSDFDNIRKLNGATKEMDANKIGRFGLGFCAVYNLTDVPSFISKNNVVIFDPQKTYLTEALEDNSPGIKIDFRRVENRKLLRLYRGQFKPFQDLFDCDVNKLQESGFPGTLFRLPLRTSAQARTSAICNVCYSSNEVLELLSKFVENAGNMLLFTQHVKHLELYHIPKGAKSVSEKVLLFRATKNSIGDSSIATHSTVLQRVTSSLSAKQHFRECERFIVSAKLTPECRSFFPKLDIQEHTVSSAWVVAWETGKNESLDLSKKIKGKRAIPVSAVAVQCDDGFTRPLREAELSSLFYKTGHMFCFLPLPIATHLKVHINGSFDVTSDRRRLITLTDDDKDSRQNKWNEFLLTDASVNAFFSLLEHFACNHQFDSGYVFHELWPSACSRVARPFSNNFFKRVIREKKELFFGEGKWVSFADVTFLCQDIRKHPDIGQIAFNMLLNIGVHGEKTLVDLPEHVAKGLAEFNDISAFILTKAEFVNLFLKNINHKYWNKKGKERNSILVYALKSSNEDIKNRIKDCSCIPVQPHGTLKKPCEVIDIYGKLSQLFTVDDEVFLDADLQQKDINTDLLKLGMVGDKLPFLTLVERFSTIEKLASEKCTSCALRRCQLLLQYLSHTSGGFVENTDLQDAVSNMFILPVLQKPNGWCFTWRASEDNTKELKPICSRSCNQEHNRVPEGRLILGKADSIFATCLKSLGGTVISVLDTDFLSGSIISIHSNVYKSLGIKYSLPTSLIIQHLTVLSNEYTGSDEEFKCIQPILSSIYDTLQERLTKSEPGDHVEIVKELQQLKYKPVVLIKNRLYAPDAIAFRLEQECFPHLLELPKTQAILKKELFQTIGVKERFTAADIVTILKGKKIKWGDQACDEIETIIKLLQNLYKCEDLTSEIKENIVGPDIHCRLHAMQDLVIEDEDLRTGISLHILHRSLAPAIAEKLGAKHKQRRCYDEITKHIGIPFGQKENLVTRINNLLDAYPCDSSIMKELLQNADDAKASELHFIKDYRRHPSERIFSECLQGPSLCVFNDSHFTEQDLQGIHHLGEGSKRGDPTKTGQYGVGFNAVYHLTDTPAFMSKGPGLPDEGLLVIFDPTCKHLPGVKDDEPGILCHIDDIKSTFPDVLAGFTISEGIFKMDKGTLFRFPFRVTQSDVSTYVHTEETIDRILDLMSNDMFESLLFVKNVSTIKISNVTSGKLVEEYYIKTEISDKDKQRRAEFFKYVQDMCQELKHKRINLQQIRIREVQYQMKVADSKGKSEDYIVVQRFGFDSESHIPETILEIYRDGLLACLPLGGVAHKISRRKQVKHASHNISRLAKKYESDKDDSVNSESKAFCFLPIAGDTSLPVHLNGHFALDDARRGLIKDGYKKEWNECILRHLVVPAYVQCIFHWRDLLTSGINNSRKVWSAGNQSQLYHSIFPLMTAVCDPYWKYLIKELYRSIVSSKCPLFPVIRKKRKFDECGVTMIGPENERTELFSCEWVPLAINGDLRNGHFNLYKFKVKLKFDKDDCHMLEALLKDLGMSIIETHDHVRKTIEMCMEEGPSCANPDTVVKFVSTSVEENGLCNISILNSQYGKVGDRTIEKLKLLVKFMTESDSFIKTLPSLPILLTDDGNLKLFSRESNVFCSEYAWMFPGASESFVHHELLYIYPTETLREAHYIKDICIESLVQMIPERLKKSLFTKDPILHWDDKLDGFPTMEWVACFWELVCKISDTDEKFFKNVSELSAWAFLPASQEGDLKLVQLSKAFLLWDSSSFHRNEPLKETLLKFKPLTLNRNVFPQEKHHMYGEKVTATMVFHTLLALTTSLDQPERLLEFLYFHYTKLSGEPFEKCNTGDAVNVLKYFSSNLALSEHPNVKEVKERLLTLPLFITLNNCCVSLDSGKQVYIIQTEMPVDGLDSLASHLNLVFLKEDNSLEELYKFLAFSDITVRKLYADIVLPNIYCIPKLLWLKHIEYIKDNVMPTGFSKHDQASNDIIDHLKGIAFVDTGITFKRCSQFYDYDYFENLCDDSEFPPDQFRNFEWRKFFITLGMHAEMTDMLLIHFAKRIEQMQVPDITTIERSEFLIKCLKKHIDNWQTKTLNSISTIRCIVPSKLKDEYTTILPPKDNGGGLICMNESVEKKNVKLCWSTLHILPFSVPEKHRKDLGIYTEPPLIDALKHIQNVSTVLKVKLKEYDQAKVTCLMNAWYDFLQKNMANSLTNDMLSSFSIVHLPSDNKMVSVNDIVIELPNYETMWPYLFKAPVVYGQFYPMFIELGTSPEVKCYHYLNVLMQIKVLVGNNELAVPELQSVKSSLLCLYQCLGVSSRREFRDFDLYLPDENKRLCRSTDLVIEDNCRIRERATEIKDIHYFIGFPKLNLSKLDPTFFVTHLPKRLRPRLLTCIMDERVDRENMQVIEDSRTAGAISAFIRSGEFVNGVCRILKQDAESSENAFDPIRVCENVHKLLLQIKTFEVGDMKTFLYYRNEKVVGSDSPGTCFCEFNRDATEVKVNFFFKSSQDNNSKMIDLVCCNEGLAKVVIQHLSLPSDMRTVLTLVRIMKDVHHPEYISNLMDDAGYPFLNMNTGINSAFPYPGKYVEEKFHPFLDHSMDIFHENEFSSVAMEVEDDGLDTEDNTEIIPIYIYVRILREVSRNEDNSSLVNVTYSVDVGEAEPILIAGYRLFRFVRPQNLTNTVTLYTGNTPQQHLPFDENCRRVRQQLLEAWTLPDEERWRVIRRILFCWHPDRNHGLEEYTTRIFIYVQQSVIRLKDTGTIDEGDETDARKTDFSHSDLSTMCSKLNRRANVYARAYRENIDDYNTSQRSGNYNHMAFSRGKIKDVNEARRWMKQAKTDFQAATTFHSEVAVNGVDAYNWICYMCHRATEKALKAACFSMDVDIVLPNHSLIQPASWLSPAIRDLAQQMENHLGFHTKMRYPNLENRPKIPSDLFTKNDAEVAMDIAKRIFDALDDVM